MRMNSRQVADRLGISLGAVKTLVQNGDLHDIGTTPEGKTKHLRVFDSRAVEVYAAEYARTVVPQVPAMVTRSNGDTHGSGGGAAGRLGKIEERLGRIETALTQLLAVWA